MDNNLYIYKRVEPNGEETFALSVPSDLTLSEPDYGSIADAAKGTRRVLWERDQLKLLETINVHFKPPADIECMPHREPARCYAPDESEQEIFWRIFSRSREDAEIMANMKSTI